MLPPGEMGTAQQESPVTTLHSSWDAAPAELRKAAETIEAHPFSLKTGLFYDCLEEAVEAFLRKGEEAFWSEIEAEL